MYMPKRGDEMKTYRHKCVYFVNYDKEKKVFWHTPIYPLDMINMKYKMTKTSRIFIEEEYTFEKDIDFT